MHVNRFRTNSNPLDFKPLLSLLSEVKGKLLSIAPKRGSVYADKINSNLDLDLIGQMLSQAAFDASSMAGAVAFICSQIIEFQAPVRNKKTNEWISSYMNEMEVQGRAFGGDAVIVLLPKLLEWVFARIDETQKDIANSHIEMVRINDGLGF